MVNPKHMDMGATLNGLPRSYLCKSKEEEITDSKGIARADAGKVEGGWEGIGMM